MISFAETLERLSGRLPHPHQIQPRESGSEADSIPDAAVVLILQDTGESTEFLIIQRAENPRDYWSGHLALPGGRADQTDESLVATAAREVAEEVGIDLSLDGDFVGQLTPLSPSTSRIPLIRVTPFVAVVREPVTLRLSHEVGSAFWASVEQLRMRGLSESMSFMIGDKLHQWPAYPSEKGPIWGLTQRIITDFLRYLE